MKVVMAIFVVCLVFAVLIKWPPDESRTSAPATSGESPEIPGNSAPRPRTGLARLIAPNEPTAADWKNAAIRSGTVSASGATLPYWVATNLRPVMDADTNTTGFHVRASNTRLPNGTIQTAFWTHKAGNSLAMDWSKARISRQNRNTNQGGLAFEEKSAEQERSNIRVQIGFGYMPPEYQKPIIDIMGPSKDGTKQELRGIVHYDHTKFQGTQCFAVSTYAIAAMPKMVGGPGGGLKTIMLFDIDKGTLVGEITLPEGARNTRPDFALDTANDVLLVVGFDINWLMAVDLRPYLSGKTNAKRPAQADQRD